MRCSSATSAEPSPLFPRDPAIFTLSVARTGDPVPENVSFAGISS
jgi:hypothetical protein